MVKVEAHVQFGVLGDVTVSISGRPVEIGSRKQRVLLAVLLCHRGRTVPAAALVDALWGELPPRSAVPTLRTLANRLRQSLACGGEPPLVGRDGGYLLDVDAHQVDAERFTGFIEAARVARGNDLARACERVPRWRCGAARRSAGWPRPIRSAWRPTTWSRHGSARSRIWPSSWLRWVGPKKPWTCWSRTWVPIRLRERPAGALMLALYRASRQADALTVHQNLRQVLDEELGIEPTPAVRELHGRILRQDRELDGARAAGFLPRSGPRSGTSSAGHNAELVAIQALLSGSRMALPAALTPFVGRAEEITAVATALGRSRLVTLIGPGGSGKTRLAIQAAQTMHEAYPDGAWFIELTSLRDPDLIPAEIAGAVGLDVGALLAGGKPLLDSLCNQLRRRQCLLVLDNCEHLVDAAAKVAGGVLARSPRVGMLATSREVLAVPGEVVVRIGGLSLPPADPAGAADLRGSEAVALFRGRAAASGGDFALTDANAAAVAEICRRLDGLPLALELAAARTRMLGVQRLADRLATMALAAGQQRAADPRHRTLAAAIEWSHDLLTPDERIVLRRLSVFPAAWTLDAAEAVASDGNSCPALGDVFNLVARLVDKSLVLTLPDDGDEPRYRLLETIRQYAAARLAEHDETDLVRERHREFWRELASQWLPRATSATWIRRVARDLDNIREVLTWSAGRGDEPAICEIVAALGGYCMYSGAPDALAWFSRAVAAPSGGIEPAAAHARMILPQLLHQATGRSVAECVVLLEDAVEFAATAGAAQALDWARAILAEATLAAGLSDEPDCLPTDELGAIAPGPAALYLSAVRAMPHLAAGNLARAREILGESASHADRHHPDDYVRVHVLALLALAQSADGDAEAAQMTAQAAVLGARAFPALRVTAMALIRAIEAALISGRVPLARELLPEALLILRDLGAPAWVNEALECTAAALAELDPAEAGACLGAATVLRTQLGAHTFVTPALRDLVARTNAQVLAVLGPDAARIAGRRGAGLDRAEMLVRAREAVLRLPEP